MNNTNSMQFVRKIRAEGCDRILVALSGGADSVALLLGLWEMGGSELFAAHLNHGIRGEEADRDEAFCRKLCEELGIRLYVESVSLPALAKERGTSVETAAREVRYEFLTRCAKELSACLATAHNANDSLETMLFNLGRGTGLKGICSIPHTRYDEKSGVKIIRPLIDISRREIEEYLGEKNRSYCVDSTNLELDATRNRIRHTVLPAFLEIFPEGLSAASRCRALLRQDSDFLEQEAESCIYEYEEKGIFALRECHPALLSRVLKRIGERLCGGALSESHVKALAGLLHSGRGSVLLPFGTEVTVRKGRFVPDGKEKAAEYPVIPLREGEYPLWEGYFAKVNREYTQIYFGVNKKATYEIKTRDIMQAAVFRTRKEGDSVFLPKRRVTKSLKKLFNELKLPYEERGSMPLLAVGSEILLLPTDEFKVQD